MSVQINGVVGDYISEGSVSHINVFGPVECPD